jgi:lauroyl/myristoyl acyltransferase
VRLSRPSTASRTHSRPHAPRHKRRAARLRGGLLTGASVLMDLASEAVRHLPPRVRYMPADAITVPLALLWWRRRTVTAQNFAIMLGLSPADPRVRTLARHSMRNFGRMAIDFLMVRTMAARDTRAWGTPVGESCLADAQRDHRGIIIVLPHAGSWDVAAAYAQAYGLQLNIVTESNFLTELVARSRTGHGVRLVPRDQSLRALFRALARDECVVLLGDIAPEGVETAEVPFFGRPAPFPLGPARIAQRTGAPIVVISCVRMPDYTYRLEAQPPLRADPTGPADAAALALTAAIAASFERIIAAWPAQWYPFHPIWPSAIGRQPSASG